MSRAISDIDAVPQALIQHDGADMCIYCAGTRTEPKDKPESHADSTNFISVSHVEGNVDTFKAGT